MRAPIYSHPDGSKLEYTHGELTATDADGNTVALPIGPTGLLELADKLIAHANETDPGNLAEQAGSGAALDCLDALLAAKVSTQSERIQIIQDAIVSLSTTTNPERAAGGFSCILANVIVRGLENLN
jgi:hypothetical protein